ncbi:hypothetical protein KKG22_02915 [Patescibacteria group bacterium]|nr:hypothetical protein [Patescibacteria group bacterium]MBU1721467.1 hypothetical protein [Patescibacteria group bacterium]MBU1900776.1 hypothetical protein [Patescibacteria group bacterium]
MEQVRVPIKESLLYGWEEFKKRPWFFIGLILAIYIVSGIGQYLLEMTKSDLLFRLVYLATQIINLIMSIGLIHISFKVYRKETPEFSELFSHTDQIWDAILLYILYSLIVLGGLILFIVPGIIFIFRYSQSFYLLLDKKLSPTEALKESRRITEGAKMDIFLAAILFGVIALLGLLALFVGIFVAIPVVMLAGTFIYFRLLETAAGDETPAIKEDKGKEVPSTKTQDKKEEKK